MSKFVRFTPKSGQTGEVSHGRCRPGPRQCDLLDEASWFGQIREAVAVGRRRVRLLRFFAERPDSKARRRRTTVKEYKAEQDREIAAIEDRQETSRRMPEKIGKHHLSLQASGAGSRAAIA